LTQKKFYKISKRSKEQLQTLTKKLFDDFFFQIKVLSTKFLTKNSHIFLKALSTTHFRILPLIEFKQILSEESKMNSISESSDLFISGQMDAYFG